MSDAPSDTDRPADLHFYFDPMCPFAWMTSKWVRMVAEQRDYIVDWRFISLRLINAGVDYDSHFPPEYAAMHLAGLKLLRIAARTRSEYGREAVGRLYAAYGEQLWDTKREWSDPTGDALTGPALATAGLPGHLTAAMEDDSFDAEIQAETDEALALTGKDVGTPILHFFTRGASEPEAGVAFFGPVISRLPSEADAAALWDHVIGLARFPGFAELKRSLRELPQLRALGVTEEEVGKQEDWHGGSRRLKK
jgi:2-hydroxychromene-2-carboxylate isomerase